MSKGGGRAPDPPDPNVVSAAQTQSNKQTAAYNAALNRGNVLTPFGSSVFTQRIDPATGAPVYDQTISLSPAQQALLDKQNSQDAALSDTQTGLLGAINDKISRPFDESALGIPQMQGSVDLSGLPELAGASGLEPARQQVQDALYKRSTSYLDPQYETRQGQLQQRLADQGITLGSEAWRSAMDQFDRGRSFDYANARNDAISGGGAELDRLGALQSANRGQLYGERLNNANLGNSSRAQALEQALAIRQQPINEFATLRGLTPIQTPQFSGASPVSMGTTDVAGNIWNAYQGNVNNYNAKQNSRNSFLSGLMGLGGSILGGPMGGAIGSAIGNGYFGQRAGNG